MGQFLASGVLKGVANVDTQLAWKLPYGLQWIWPVPLFIVLYLAPESPWWLVRKGRKEEATQSLLRLTSRKVVEFDAEKTINLMVFTTELEFASEEGASYWDCFKGVNLRRTEIASFVWAIQVLCGGYMMGYSTYFFEQAGKLTQSEKTLATPTDIPSPRPQPSQRILHVSRSMRPRIPRHHQLLVPDVLLRPSLPVHMGPNRHGRLPGRRRLHGS